MTRAGDLQAILDGPWQFAADAREAYGSAEDWLLFQKKQKPPPSRLRIAGRRAYDACLEAAAGTLEGTRVIRVEVVPVWVSDNPDEVAHAEWFAPQAVRLEDGPLEIWEPRPILEDSSPVVESRAVCESRWWRTGPRC